MDRPVYVVGLGGTIGSRGIGAIDPAYYRRGDRISISNLVRQLPQKWRNLVEYEDLAIKGSADLSTLDVKRVAEHVNRRVGELDACGVVITQGTNTLEETSFLLFCLRTVRVPILVTGAMRPHTEAGSDALRNVIDSIRVILDVSGPSHGTWVLMAGEVHDPRWVTKVASDGLDSFKSGWRGPSARLSTHTLRVRSGGLDVEGPRINVETLGDDANPRVDIYYAYQGSEGRALEAILAAHPSGIVVAGFGPGSLSTAERFVLEDAVRTDVAVVMTSRSAYGSAWRVTHDDSGWLFGGDLSPLKTRIALELALWSGAQSSDSIDQFLRRCRNG